MSQQVPAAAQPRAHPTSDERQDTWKKEAPSHLADGRMTDKYSYFGKISDGQTNAIKYSIRLSALHPLFNDYPRQRTPGSDRV